MLSLSFHLRPISAVQGHFQFLGQKPWLHHGQILCEYATQINFFLCYVYCKRPRTTRMRQSFSDGVTFSVIKRHLLVINGGFRVIICVFSVSRTRKVQNQHYLAAYDQMQHLRVFQSRVFRNDFFGRSQQSFFVFFPVFWLSFIQY